MCILTYKQKSLYIERNRIISVGGGALIFFIASFFINAYMTHRLVEWVPIGLNNVEVIGEGILECCEKEVD